MAMNLSQFKVGDIVQVDEACSFCKFKYGIIKSINYDISTVIVDFDGDECKFFNFGIYYLKKILIGLDMNKEGDKQMENNNSGIKILEFWKQRKLKELEDEKEKGIEQLIKSDEIANQLITFREYCKEAGTQLEKQYPEINFNISLSTNAIELVITPETKQKMKDLDKACELKKDEIREKFYEMSAAISICSNEDSIRNVLKEYNVIDKKGKIK